MAKTMNAEVERTTDAPKVRNLPPQSTPFVGRNEELAEISALLAKEPCRLLTLVGPGGIGKTRLAIEVAIRTVVDHAPDGAAFVPLQGVQPGYLASAMAEAAGVPLSGQEEPRDQLLRHLHSKQMLLVLDSFEHLLTSELDLVAEVLRAARGVCLLITSRQALNLRQEWRYRVSGLQVPTSMADEDLVAYSAAQLFAARARHVRHDFSLTAERAGVVRICQLVEGMPLALELAASWLTTLSCAQIAAEIHRHLDFLSTRLQDVPERHRNMQAVFDQSWALLTAEERAVFSRLSVFQGGFQREAAKEVTDTSLNILSSLVDKSLLRREPDGRYQIHELLRQYAAERLGTSPDAVTQARDRHCAYFTEFMQQRLTNISHQRRDVQEIAAELDNVRAAWQWAVEQGKSEALDKAASTWFYFCQIQGRYPEGEAALAAAARSLEQQAPTPERDQVLAQVLDDQGWLCIRLGLLDKAQDALEQSLALYQKRDAAPAPGMGTDPRTALGVLATVRGDYTQAVQFGAEARQLSEARDDSWNRMFAYYVLAGASLAQGQLQAAGDYARQGYDNARRLNAQWFMAYLLNELGDVARALGHYTEARQNYQTSYAMRQEFDDPEGMAVALNHLGQIAFLQGDAAEAQRIYNHSQVIYRKIGDLGGLATALNGLGRAACALGDYQDAGKQIHEALQIADEIRFLPLTLATLVSAGELLLRTDRPESAAELLSLVVRYPASEQAVVERARELLGQCQARLQPARFDSARQRGESRNLAATVTATLTQLVAATDEDTRPLVGPEKQPIVEPLTPRELEVLDLIAEGLTNRDIADELVLAVGTVKWYTSQIYGKLGVSSRTEAVAQARELGLLS